jgi:hypothetical protein
VTPRLHARPLPPCPSALAFVRAGAIALALLPLAGCDAVSGTAAGHNPFASFETRCAQLPPARVAVVQAPVEIATNDTRTYAELTKLHDDLAPRHRTIGLTQATVGHTSKLEFRGLQDGKGKRICVRPSVEVVLTLSPMTVYVASEFAGDNCRRTAIFGHEMRHVAVYKAYVAEIAGTIAADLDRTFGGQLFYFADDAAAQARLSDLLAEHLAPVLETSRNELAWRQSAVDSPAEYDRVANACGGIHLEAERP